MSKLPEKLKELRKLKDMNQTQVANNLGLQYYTLGKWEQGRAEPSVEDLEKLADFFEVSVDYLIGREDDIGNITISGQSTDQNLSPNEEELLESFNKLNLFEQDSILVQVRALAEKHKVKK